MKLHRDLPESPGNHVVVVLGASPKPTRYSNRAVRLLVATGYHVIPVHPKVVTIEGLKVTSHLRMIETDVHTLTLYLGPERCRPVIPHIVGLNPHRVILNPGTESVELEHQLMAHHIEIIHGCTLVMLQTGLF